MMHRKQLAAVLLFLLLALLPYRTLAYFTDEARTNNVITTGNLSLQLHEVDADGKPFPSGALSGVMPGAEITKQVYVENTGAAAMWVRVRLQPQVSNGLSFAPYFSLDLDTAHWEERDGWYYYGSPLTAGHVTENLFSTLRVSPDMANAYQDCTLTISIQAQAVQYDNNGGTVWEATGWPAE